MDMSEFSAMIEESPVRSLVVEYHDASTKALAAVCLTDMLSDGVSMVYSFFDPDLASASLGSFVILDHIAMAREHDVPYVYLGYWVPGSAKMDYKARYQPLEIFADGAWSRLAETDVGSFAHRRGDRPAISEQVAAIELPVTK